LLRTLIRQSINSH